MIPSINLKFARIEESTVSPVKKIASVTPLQTVAEKQVDTRLSSHRVNLQTATGDSIFTAASPFYRPQYGLRWRSKGHTLSLISRLIFGKHLSIAPEESKITSNAVLHRVGPIFEPVQINNKTTDIEVSASATYKIMPAVERNSPELCTNKDSVEKYICTEGMATSNWNPTLLLNKLYEVSYEPRKESKLNRFTNMEGHLEVPVDGESIYAELQKNWVQKYFRTRDGRLQWFASHFADDTPVGEILLSGCEVDANRDENALYIHGGKSHIRMMLRIPPGANVFDKWRKAMNSHAASSYLDTFVNPVYPPLPHLTEHALTLQKVAIIELGSCSMRAGVLTMEPSLPQSFFPTIVLIKDDGTFIVGGDALLPENRRKGELIRPLRATDISLERYIFHRSALKACLKKCVDDLKIDPTNYRVLLSIPQNIPTALIADLLKIILEEMCFQGAAISRQPSLVLYAYDVATGVVVDIGDCVNIVPVIDGVF
ncbi:unnamed protein product [Onchocerca ochengi]|uniref:PH domain-containing protein n=1 Tax=Onchocerca ochengi TaxID=42157 RepID=A0A182E106_ONCOC|nr:unnamed protein product [Onchocerca ochengi]